MADELTDDDRSLRLGRCGLCKKLVRANNHRGTWKCNDANGVGNEMAGQPLPLDLLNRLHRCAGFVEKLVLVT